MQTPVRLPNGFEWTLYVLPVDGLDYSLRVEDVLLIAGLGLGVGLAVALLPSGVPSGVAGVTASLLYSPSSLSTPSKVSLAA